MTCEDTDFEESNKMADLSHSQTVRGQLRFQIVQTPMSLRKTYGLTAENCILDTLTNEYYCVSPMNMFHLMNCNRHLVNPMKI